MVVGSTIIGILGNVWFNTLHLSVVVSYGSVIIVGGHNLSKSRIIEGPSYDCQTRKWQGPAWQSWRTMIRIVVMCHDAHTSVTAEGVGGTLDVEGSMRLVVFRIKWVWIWQQLPDTKLSSGGAFFVGKSSWDFKKKKKIHLSEKANVLVTLNLTFTFNVPSNY
jgi:hypothetical protein